MLLNSLLADEAQSGFGAMMQEVTQYFCNFDGIQNTFRSVSLWVAIALVIAFIVSKIVVGSNTKRYTEERAAAVNKTFNTVWIVIALLFAAAEIVAFVVFYLTDVKNGEDTLVPILYYPMLAFIVCVVATAAIVYFLPKQQGVKIVCYALCGAALLSVIVCMAVYSADGEAGEPLHNIGLYVSAIAIVIVIAVTAFLTDRNSRPFDSRSLAFAAVCVAPGFALSYVRFFKMPMGGSITFASLLPLMLYSYMFGCRKGVIAGLVYGVLQAIQDPWIIHPAQFALDYAVAFAGIGLAGCFKCMNVLEGKTRLQFTLGAIVAGLFRFVSAFFSGAFAFGAYGADYAEQFGIPALANEYFYSFVYQCLYIIPDLLIVIVVAVILFSSKNVVREVNRYAMLNRKKAQPLPEPAAEEQAVPPQA